MERRHFLTALAGGAATLVAAPAILRAETAGDGIARRVSGFATHRWQDHFDNLKNGAILCDTEARVLFYWSEDESITRIFPTSVPLSDELTRRGRTEITLKRNGPEWRPTPSMLERNPELPRYVGPGPENPLGTHALNLSWQYYRIHGTNDVRKIGRRSSNGCIGLFNEQIAELFGLAKVGTQVVLL
ncbi:L,D-transpeptidase [Halovulum dunhuangense]|uniref:L,D-transpeptidase n=1 Tax=Halovulum dunhuangense TaxID=1505036 RepID=A0A849L193_9RHOB|nr:L,D-transpeptidase [Halovulum dunhuangense]NNU80021.1 L,D-transpeptidase [Halovulum dunhuangense]